MFMHQNIVFNRTKTRQAKLSCFGNEKLMQGFFGLKFGRGQVLGWVVYCFIFGTLGKFGESYT